MELSGGMLDGVGALIRSLCAKHSVRKKKLSQQNCCNKWLDESHYIMCAQGAVKWFFMTAGKKSCHSHLAGRIRELGGCGQKDSEDSQKDFAWSRCHGMEKSMAAWTVDPQ
jgi:hypothetical protein